MKVNIKTTLKNKEGIHSFEGKSIKNNNTITYKDKNKINTILSIHLILLDKILTNKTSK